MILAEAGVLASWREYWQLEESEIAIIQRAYVDLMEERKPKK